MMQPNIQSKLPNAGPTIFTVMSSLATTHNAINLGQGFPDFGIAPALQAYVTEAMQQGHNQYIHAYGLPQLRERIAEKVLKLYQQPINFETEITITPGGTYAIYTALTAIVQPGDEVIVFEPAYDSYIPNIEINGGVAVTIPLTYPDYNIDWQRVKEKISSKTKAIIINSPHNPSGAVIGEKDIEQLREIVNNTGIFIISDEVYEHLIFEGKTHFSMLAYPDLYARSFVCFSLGKVFNCTGWKLGYCISPAMFTTEFRKVHQFNCFTCFGPAQYGFAQILGDDTHYLQLGAMLQKKRDYFMEQMKQTKFEPLPSYGSYFQLYSYKNISEEKEHSFAERLVKEVGVATIPVAAFYKTPVENQVVRFCFAKKESTLQLAAEKLASLQ